MDGSETDWGTAETNMLSLSSQRVQWALCHFISVCACKCMTVQSARVLEKSKCCCREVAFSLRVCRNNHHRGTRAIRFLLSASTYISVCRVVSSAQLQKMSLWRGKKRTVQCGKTMDNSVCLVAGSLMFASLSQPCSLNTARHLWPEIKRVKLKLQEIQAHDHNL